MVDWKPLDFLIGAWRGEGRGAPGRSDVERSYEFVLDGKFIQAKNKSKYDPTENHPEGELHEDFGLISYDKSRSKFVLRQFHVEGFVNQYVTEPPAAGASGFAFVSEAIENIPPGWRARETYAILGPDEFTETFELAEPGKDFELYTKNTFRRVK